MGRRKVEKPIKSNKEALSYWLLASMMNNIGRTWEAKRFEKIARKKEKKNAKRTNR